MREAAAFQSSIDRIPSSIACMYPPKRFSRNPHELMEKPKEKPMAQEEVAALRQAIIEKLMTM